MPIDDPNFISKLNPKELGNHLRKYSELFINPVKSWKKAYTQRKSGFDFTTLNIIYYSILVLILLKDFYLTAQIVILEILVTLIPLLIFVVPFAISKKVFRFRKKWTKLFRVFLIIKFQFIPPFVLLVLFTKWSKIESFYILIENGIWFVWLGFILIVPIINKINPLKKLAWVAMNYVFLLFGFFLIGLIFHFAQPNDEFFTKLQLKTPNQEYQSVRLESSWTLNRIIDDGYIVVLQPLDSEFFSINRVQFASPELALIITQNSRNEIIKHQLEIDSILGKMDSTYISKRDSYELDSVITLNNQFLDSIRTKTNEYFYSDLNLYSKAKDSSAFKSNKEYFGLYYNSLKHYEELFTNIETTKKIVSTIEPQSTVQINGSEIVAYYDLPEEYVYEEKKRLMKLKDQLEKRESNSSFMLNLMFYPLDKILDLTGVY